MITLSSFLLHNPWASGTWWICPMDLLQGSTYDHCGPLLLAAHRPLWWHNLWLYFSIILATPLITNSFFLATRLTQKKYPFRKYNLCGICHTSIDLKLIHTAKGDAFYFGYYINKLSICKSGGIAWLLIVIINIQCLFYSDLRFTTIPTQSVICDRKCRMSEFAG